MTLSSSGVFRSDAPPGTALWVAAGSFRDRPLCTLVAAHKAGRDKPSAPPSSARVRLSRFFFQQLAGIAPVGTSREWVKIAFRPGAAKFLRSKHAEARPLNWLAKNLGYSEQGIVPPSPLTAGAGLGDVVSDAFQLGQLPSPTTEKDPKGSDEKTARGSQPSLSPVNSRVRVRLWL
jgi:hypothetical protein